MSLNLNCNFYLHIQSFLNNFKTYIEIEDWVDKLTSRIVLKFEEENEQLQDFIYDYIKNG